MATKVLKISTGKGPLRKYVRDYKSVIIKARQGHRVKSDLPAVGKSMTIVCRPNTSSYIYITYRSYDYLCTVKND